MARKKRDKIENLVGQLIRSELETQLTRMVRKAKKKAMREAGKLNEALQLEYHKSEGFVEADYEDIHPEGKEVPEVKKTEDEHG